MAIDSVSCIPCPWSVLHPHGEGIVVGEWPKCATLTSESHTFPLVSKKSENIKKEECSLYIIYKNQVSKN